MAGLSAMPARAPWARISRASRTGAAAASTWKVTEPAPASTYAGAQRSGSVDHQVRVERLSVVPARSASTIGRAEGQVRHEVVVHHVDVHPVGAAGSAPTSAPRSAKSAVRMLGVIWMPMRPILVVGAGNDSSFGRSAGGAAPVPTCPGRPELPQGAMCRYSWCLDVGARHGPRSRPHHRSQATSRSLLRSVDVPAGSSRRPTRSSAGRGRRPGRRSRPGRR